jgi:hypothetical protein
MGVKTIGVLSLTLSLDKERENRKRRVDYARVS